jgi:metalloendopeptidase OMA1, mitochondrial
MNGDGYSGNPGQRLMQILVALVIGVLAMGLFAARGCQRGPFGRRQVVALTPEQETKLGIQAYDEVLHDAPVLPKDSPVAEDVEEVTRRLVKAATNQQFLQMTKIPREQAVRIQQGAEVHVVRSKEVNAFCLPGGKMVVYTAILPVCETDAGLATVMGHEIAHALAQHGAERMAQTQMVNIGVTAAGGALGNMDPRDRARVMAVLNAGAQFGILKYSRKHESEADHIGLLLMAAAGYDPHESVKFWERMRKRAGGGKTPEFLSTHPSHETRIRDLTNWIPQAMSLYRESGHSEPPKKLHLGGERARAHQLRRSPP